ncbi:helicase-related protein [Verrucomicrobiales bacterium]|nr:helicase-related protein [Verrucomicrobiales bacterium]
MTEEFQPDQRVIHRSHPEYGIGTVKLVEVDPLGDEAIASVAFDWKLGTIHCSTDSLQLTPVVRGGEVVAQNLLGSAHELRRRLGAAFVHAENSRSGSFLRSFITPLPHQAFLLEKIHSSRRYGHLVADDVGMGKTIEAGLLISSFIRDNPRTRVLILSPKGLLLQWQDEMREHFNLSFLVAGRDFTASQANVWEQVDFVIASIDTLKQDRYRDLLKGVHEFDFVICDEAHRLTARREFLSGDLVRTQSYRFVQWLGTEGLVSWEADPEGKPRSPRILLLTATPHQGDNLRFAYLLHLVRPDLVDPNNDKPLTDDDAVLRDCMTRTPKQRAVDWEGATIFKGHEAQSHDLQITVQEKEVLRALSRYVQEDMVIETSGQAEALVRTLAVHTYQKIAASSWAALLCSLNARMEGNRCASETEDDISISEFELLGGEAERKALESLIRKVESLPRDSKLDYFLELVLRTPSFREPDEKVLVFTQYRETQLHLKGHLEEQGQKVAVIHGGLNLDDRRREREFFEDEADVLISTEAGSEGANLHRKCHLMVTFDLSWNPMRMLQRIGRLDRFGQKHRVKVVNIRLPEAWDSVISDKILEKLAVTGHTLGRVAEEDYESMILGEVFESIDVGSVMAETDWGADEEKLDAVIGREVENVLKNQTEFKLLCEAALGMPEGFTEKGAEIGTGEFRDAFAWAAEGHGIRLMESRTSEGAFLKGVYHFTLPEEFRAGLRASRECYLVFDRELFAEVRGNVIGRARGQEIKPELAGFGDGITDWFFRSALSGTPTGTVFHVKAGHEESLQDVWWIVFLSSWKGGDSWRGPESVFVFETDNDGKVRRAIPSPDVMKTLGRCDAFAPSSDLEVPPIEESLSLVRDELKKNLQGEERVDRSRLTLVPWMAIRWRGCSAEGKNSFD